MAMVASMLLLPTLRATARGTVQSDMQDQALLVFTLMTRDFDTAVAQGVSLRSDQHGLALMPIHDVQDKGTLIWLPEFVSYSWDAVSQTVVRRVWHAPGPPNLGVIPDGSEPLRLSDAQMVQIAGATGLETRSVATGVTDFTLQQSGPLPGVTDAVKLSMTLLRQAATGRTTPETFSLSRSLTFRNRY
jgi:hypothetical protein